MSNISLKKKVHGVISTEAALKTTATPSLCTFAEYTKSMGTAQNPHTQDFVCPSPIHGDNHITFSVNVPHS